MKRLTTIILALFALNNIQLHCTIASPTPFEYVQPDGTRVRVQLHGDEFNHWATIEGRRVALGKDGFYRPEIQPARTAVRTPGFTRAASRLRSVQRKGSPHFLVLLIEFSDVRFTVDNPKRTFTDMLNLEGYSENDGTGSARDYYADNSCGKFLPTFDVVGPITLSRSCAYYGADYVRSSEALYDACLLADPVIDFSQYDGDADGVVDNVFFYFAGHNEAEGGGSDTIWPHSWALDYFNCVCDGVKVYRYACTSEYRGPSGRNMCGIGTFCHEFGHILGLPDLYDIDYGKNGYADNLDAYSLMASGNYNNFGRTPPFLTGVERMILGWLDKAEVWTSGGFKTVNPVQDNVTYRTETATPGEWFVFETRNGLSWDSPLPPGLIISHLDQSERNVHGMTARQRWDVWDINSYADHPCYYVVHAGEEDLTYYPFPGRSAVTSFGKNTSPSYRDWDGKYTGFSAEAIAFDGKVSTLFLASDSTSLLDMGFNYIRISPEEYSSGESFSFVMETGTNPPQSVKWFFDGNEQTSESVVLTSGTHTVKAVLTYPDGSTEKMSAEIHAK